MSTVTLPRPSNAPTSSSPQQSRLRSLVRGRAEDPAWARPLLIALLVGTAVAYLINLTASGYANSFYAAAVEAGTRSWKAFFFGSLDASNYITVDKPPASLWVMELSGRLFGFSSASMLVPQVLEGVLSVGLVAAAVKRWYGAGAGLLAGTVLAATPVAALMFRFNNPDALLVCLLVGSAYCLVRALEHASTKWLLGVGALLGFAFLAKMMQAFLVLPGFALVYLFAAPVDVRKRVWQLLAGAGAMMLAAGWWVTIVAVWPVGSRPMIDGSPDNSIINLILEYNGLGRLTGGGAGGGGGGGNFSGPTGFLRLFDTEMGAQSAWLIPAAVIVLVAGLIWRRRAPRTDRARAGLLIWGSWLVITAAVFSFSQGVIHTYYTVALAPAIAALVGIGAATLWKHREEQVARVLMAVIIAITAAVAVLLLQRDSGWEPWLTPLVVLASLAALGGLLIPGPQRRRLSAVTAVAAVIACMAGPVAYSAQTIGAAHTGSVPSAGPAGTGSGFGGGAAGGGGGGFPGGGSRSAGVGAGRGTSGTGGPPTGSTGSSGSGGSSGAGTNVSSLFGSGARTGSQRTPGIGSTGSPGSAASTSSAVVKLLESGAEGYRWAAATEGSQSAAELMLASNGTAVMAIGGFNGEGGNLTLAQFEAYVKAGDIHYYIAGQGMGGPGGPSSSSSSISSWVKAHYKSETVGGETVYNLAQPLS